MSKITEWCPYCEDEVELNDKFCVQICPKCGHPILPCSICEHTNNHDCHTECDTCPLGKLEGIHITSSNIYYENIRVIDDMGCEYFLNLESLTRILSQLNYKVEKKRKRTWITPTFDVKAEVLPNDLNEVEADKLKQVLDVFELQTTHETGVHRISGGFAQADFSSCDRDWVYITLKWGVQNDVDDDVHEEDWKIARDVLLSDKSIKEMVENIID